ncbi:MAG: hypothetical protein ACRDP7_11275 [Trebonia sp.]
MTRDRARKKAIRARMAATREPYSVAARQLDDASPASDAPAGDAVIHEVIARLNATLAAPSARIESRRDIDVGPRERQTRPRPGPVGRLARLAAGAAWKRIAPGVDAGELRELFLHQVGVGFMEPATGRYQIDYGEYAQAYIDGELFGGQSGAPLRANNRVRREPPRENDPLGLLGLLHQVTRARYSGADTLRGTPCRAVAVLAGSAELTVWIDAEHVRRIQSEWRDRGPGRGSWVRTLELWDFGVAVGSLDWSRLPRFVEPS